MNLKIIQITFSWGSTTEPLTERTMNDSIEDHGDSVSIGDRIFINFRFADNIVVNAEEEEYGYNSGAGSYTKFNGTRTGIGVLFLSLIICNVLYLKIVNLKVAHASSTISAVMFYDELLKMTV